ncbi:MAG: hypothetical protein KME13_26330 [Myxacorys californica WJT36-NPBG1]|jgi:hypothetical protein|nr:hypothetical protein [Myxacorys californica WJT36-NPBG1]
MPTPENPPNHQFSEEWTEASFHKMPEDELETSSFSQLPIPASISPQILTKVTRLFNGGLEDIVNELFQNARRAGATQVEVILTQLGTLLIEDDGCGIENPKTLLSLGQSEWDAKVVESEDPAGMGIFSLANRGATIASHNWHVHLDPEHFSGQAIAIVQSTEARVGTRIEFPLTAAELRSFEVWRSQSLHPQIASAARYYPLPVTFNRAALLRQDFLEDAVWVKLWRGLRLGVSAHYRWANQSVEGLLNFYGLTVPLQLPALACNDTTLHVRVDVDAAPDLKLVLPARKEIVRNEFFDELKVELRRTLYEAVATLEHHDLPYVRWLEAHSFGIELPPARSQLRPFTPRTADHLANQSWESLQPIDPTTMLIEVGDLQAPEQQLLKRALNHSELPYTFLAAESKYQGYSWYSPTNPG